jgi:hypothetical protein
MQSQVALTCAEVWIPLERHGILNAAVASFEALITEPYREGRDQHREKVEINIERRQRST